MFSILFCGLVYSFFQEGVSSFECFLIIAGLWSNLKYPFPCKYRVIPQFFFILTKIETVEEVSVLMKVFY
jgi:hypothetical protein